MVKGKFVKTSKIVACRSKNVSRSKTKLFEGNFCNMASKKSAVSSKRLVASLDIKADIYKLSLTVNDSKFILFFEASL